MLVSLLALLSGVYLYMAIAAPATKSWDFSSSSDYTVYKGDGTEDTGNEVIEVADGVAKLVPQTETLNDDTAADYNAGTLTNTVAQGQDVKLILTNTGTTYNTPGTFTSRVFDGGTGNKWLRMRGNIDGIWNKSAVLWTYVEGPEDYGSVIDVSATHDAWFHSYGCDHPSVINDGGTYKMWFAGYSYIHDYRWRYRIGYATSPDCVNWTLYEGSQLGYSVLSTGASGKFDNEYAFAPCVIKDGSTYKMWYTGYSQIAAEWHYRIGYAESADGVNWTRIVGPGTGDCVIDMGSSGDFDSMHVHAPCVIKDGSTYKMWYLGYDSKQWAGIGYATSTNGIDWTKVRGPFANGAVLVPGALDFDAYRVGYTCVIKDGSVYKMWYGGGGRGHESGTDNERIGYAISYDGITWTTLQGPFTGGCVVDFGINSGKYDYQIVTGPCVINDNGTYRMWLQGYYNSYWRIGYKTGYVDPALPTTVKFQLRSGTTSGLSGDFVGPDGTTNSYYVIDNFYPMRYRTGRYDSGYYMHIPRMSKTAVLKTAGNFNQNHRYVQYKAILDGASDGSATPYIDWVAFEGTKVTRFDNVLGDFSRGTFDSNVTTTMKDDGAKLFVGLAQAPEGGYYASGSYTSRVLDGGSDAVWNSIAWSKGGQAISAPEPGLVALYHLDSNVNDSSGRGNNGTVVGSLSYDTSNKKFGTACWNNSAGLAGNYFKVPNNSTTNYFEALTVTAWVYFDDPTNTGGLVVAPYTNIDSSNYFYLSASPTGITGYFRDGRTGAEYAHTLYPDLFGYKQWHHVAMVWDGRRELEGTRLYLDGVRLYDTTYNVTNFGNFFELRYFDKEMYVGNYFWGADYPFKGRIDEVAIYNRPLSDDEIMRQYRRGSEIKFQCRSAASVSELEAADFIGPDGTTSTFYSTPSGTSFGEEIAAGRYFQYRAYLFGGGISTPSLDSVTVTYNTSSTFTDDERSEFDQGTYDGEGTEWHPDDLRIVEYPELGVGVSPISNSTSGLVALYHMDGDWSDASGNANDGTGYQVTSFVEHAKVGTHAGSFNAYPYVDCGNIDIAGDMTVEFWYRLNSMPSNYVLFSDYSNSLSKAQIAIFAGGWPMTGLYYQHRNTDGSWTGTFCYQYYKGSVFGQWNHFAVVRNDTTKLVKMYLNGKMISDACYTGLSVVPGTETANDTIGRYGDYSGYYYYGLIDEFALYNRALSDEEVRQHAGAGYMVGGTNSFVSQAIDAGQSASWSSINWGELARGYGDALTLPSQGSEIPIDTPGLTNLWHFNGDWNDSKGSLHGTPEGDATFDTSNQVLGSACATLDGTGDAVTFGNAGSQVKTVEFWVYTDQSTGGLVELKNNTNYISLANTNHFYPSTTYSGYVSTTGITAPIIYVNGSPYEYCYSGQNDNDGGFISTGWTHVAVVTATGISSSAVRIGEANTSFLNGKIDELALYNRVLTQSEIKGHYLSGRGSSHILALWHMDDSWADATGKGHDGTASGATFNAGGKFGSCGYFDGSSYVSFPDVGLPWGSSSRTIELWVKTTQEAYPYFFHYGTHADNYLYEIFLGMTKYAYNVSNIRTGNYSNTAEMYSVVAGALEVGHDNTYYAANCTNMPINDGEWHHIALVLRNYYGKFYSQPYATIYIDGEQKNTGEWYGSQYYYKFYTTLSGTGRIGDSISGSMGFKGYIDELAVYNCVLSTEEIRDHYQRGISNLRMQVSRDGGTTWTDANGTANQYIDDSPSSLALGSASQTLRYRGYFSTGSQYYSPVMEGVDLETAVYDQTNPYVIPNTGQAYTGYLGSFAQTPGAGNEGILKYQISSDDGSTWYWWNGSAWAATSQGYITSNTASEINSNIDSFYEQVGGGTLKFKAFLHSAGLEPVELSQVDAQYAIGRITMTYPNGGETLLTGSYADLTWTGAGTLGTSWDISYSKDAGSTWNTIVTGTTVNEVGGVYTYRWNPIPSAAATALGRIKVVQNGDTTIKDTSNANFTIGTGFEIISPNGGEKVYAGTDDNTISWKSSGGVGSSVYLYYTVNGTDWTEITDSAPNAIGTNNYTNWDIADDDSVYSETCKVKVENPGVGKSDVSNADFTIAGIKLSAPTEGSLVRRNASYDITWKSGGAGSTVKIEYSTNGGTDWTTITTNAPNTGGTNTYAWNVDAPLSSNAKMRITSNSDANLNYTTPGAFTFGDIQLAAPNGGECWQGGKNNATVTWSSAGVTGTVSLYYSTNNTDWTAIATGLTNDGSYTPADGFTVPMVMSDTVKFRIVADNDPTFADTSDSNFSIAGVQVTAPNGGEAWNMTSQNSITWNYNNAGETCALYYSLDGGSAYSLIADSIYLIDGTYSWRPSLTAGVTPTARGRVKIVAENPAGDPNPPDPYTAPMDDVSNANFTIAGLKVTAPALNANWLIGSTQSVQWLSAGTSSATATIYYSVIGDFSDQVAIATDVPNNEVYPGNNTYSWPIGSTITPSITAKVKVVAGANNATSSAFTLKGIKVTAPALGAIITQGAASNVTWTSAGVSGNVNIYYSNDGGSNYHATPINASPITVATGTYSWTPNTLVYTPSETAKLKIEVVSGADIGMYVESPVFTLKGIRISAPTTGTSWDLGSTNSITWNSAGAGSTCNIYYAADGSNFGDPINASAVLLSAGTYSWEIPSTTTPSNGVAKIRITSDTNVSSTSYAFTVKGIKVTDPTATTMWEVGEDVSTTWLGVGTGGTYDVYYVISGAETKMNTTPVSGQSFDWTVESGAVGTSVVIRIKDLGPSAYIGNSQAFQVVGEATLTVNTPATGYKWDVSEDETITWTRSGSAERTFTVEYDDNQSFSSPESISGTPAYDGAGHYSLDWSIPDSCGTRYIRITDINNPTVTDTSDAFKILPKFRVNTPNGGNTFYALKPGTTVNWGTTGTAGTVDLYYSTDSPLYETWTKINTTAISDNGSGTTEAITSYSWTVANVQSTLTKFRVKAASANLADAYDDSDEVFTIKYYDVTWNVKSATTDDFLDKLFVIDTSGWAAADLTAPVEHSYPYGTYSTTWSRTDYLDKSHRNWTTTSDDMTIEISMTESSLSPEYHVMSNFSYNASEDQFLINSWVERGGIILSQPSSCVVHIYDAAGGPIQTLTATTYDQNGVFWQEWPTTGLDQNAMYFAKVDITYSGETYSSGLSYSLNIPKSIAGLGTTVAQQLTNLQTAIGTDLATQTTAISAKIDTLETSIGTNLDAKISTVKTDIAAVKTVVDRIEETVGAIGGDLATPISEAVAENLAAQLAKGIQAEILTRPTSAGFGTATDIRFRTATGMSPTITVYDANNVARVAAAAMVEVGTTGIYEYALTPQSAWGAGEYTVVCEEPSKNAVDSMVLSVSESVGAGAGTDEGMVNSINATVTTIDSNVKTMLSKVNTLPDDTTDVNTSVSSLLATVGKTTDAAGTNTLFGKIASAQGDITAFKADITNYVDGVETTLGTTADAAGTNTVYGKIRSLEQTLSALGPDGKKASKELLAAKDQAAAASKAAEDIKKMIAAGGKNAEAYGALQKLAGDLAKLQAANSRIGSSVTADSITDFIRETRAKLAQVAMKEGYDNLVPETGEVGQVNLTEEEDVEDLRNNMTELKALLSQVRSLLDKQVNAPVVKSWIEGK